MSAVVRPSFTTDDIISLLQHLLEAARCDGFVKIEDADYIMIGSPIAEPWTHFFDDRDPQWRLITGEARVEMEFGWESIFADSIMHRNPGYIRTGRDTLKIDVGGCQYIFNLMRVDADRRPWRDAKPVPQVLLR